MRERTRDRNTQPPADQHTGDDESRLADLRSAGEDFLRAADDAIKRGLSTDSAVFLAAARQQGGQ
jgi:hypothetical protein